MKSTKIQERAILLRSQLTTIQKFQEALNVLFKGQAQIEFDNDGQIVIYTGHTILTDKQNNQKVFSEDTLHFLHSGLDSGDM